MSRLPVDARGTASRLRSVEERTRASAAVGLALHPSPGLYHCGVGGVCLAELGAEERPGAAGDEPPQQLQRAGRNVPGVRTMAGGVRAICSVTGTVAVFSPAVWPGKRGRLSCCGTAERGRLTESAGSKTAGSGSHFLSGACCGSVRGERVTSVSAPGHHSRAARIPSPGEGGRTVRRGHEDFREASNRKWICSY